MKEYPVDGVVFLTLEVDFLIFWISRVFGVSVNDSQSENHAVLRLVNLSSACSDRS